MKAGSFGRFPETNNIRERIANHTFEHDLEGNTVRAVIQLDAGTTRVNHRNLLKGMVIDHKMLPSNELVEVEGMFRIDTEIRPRPVWTRFEILGNDLVRVDNSAARLVAFNVLSHGLGGVMDYVRPVNFDLQRLSRDYRGHWVGGIQDREGHMQSGIFWGNQIERDDAIGPCYRNGTKNQVGYETEYFNEGVTKVRVTREGSIQVYANITDELYFQYVIDELSDYMVDAPLTRRRHIF